MKVAMLFAPRPESHGDPLSQTCPNEISTQLGDLFAIKGKLKNIC